MLYALLVGIDAYPSQLRPLHGCVNDVDAMEAFLRERYADPSSLQVCVLRDSEATRAAVIEAFRTHLGHAGPGDTALFHFSGHGSQQPSSPEFWVVEPDHLDETLVCWDSRIDGRWDLADKELSTLIAEPASRGAHVVVVLDCCHSGSGTRLGSAGIRGIPADTRTRPQDSLIAPLPAARDRVGWELPDAGRHILIAACLPWEVAHEYPGRDGVHGALTHALLLTLRRARRQLSYRDLFKRASAIVRRYSPQAPQLEATDLRDLERNFLDGAAPGRGPHLTVVSKGRRWFVDAGAVHGMPVGDATDRPVLALFPVGTEGRSLREPRNAVGRAVVTSVEPAWSEVEVALDSSSRVERSYAATVLSLPLPQLAVRLEGDLAATNALRRALASPPSALVREAPAEARYHLTARRDAQGVAFVLAREADGREVARSVWQGDADTRTVVARLEHVARWETVLHLHNSLGQMPPDAVRMTFFVGRREVSGPELQLSYVRRGNTWKPPSFRLRVENRWDEPLYCAVLALSEAFEIFPDFLPGSWLGTGQSVHANEGKPILARIPDALAREGVTRRIDRVKLVASTEAFDASILKQPSLLSTSTAVRASASPPRSVLGRLMERVALRSAAGESDIGHVWMTADARVITLRPPSAAPV